MEKQVSRRNKRYKAKRLFFTKKYTNKQICAMVDVSEATMSKWIKHFGWKDPETASLIPDSAVFGFKHKGFYDYLKSHSPQLIEHLNIELKGFMDAKKGITARQKAQINRLISPIGLDKNDQHLLYTEITCRIINDISQLKYIEAVNLIDYLSHEDNVLELIIKKVNP